YYSFGNLYDTIKEITGRDLYVHIPGIEFEYELTRDGVIKFFGHTKIIKGGDGVYGCKFEGGSISDLSQDDFPSINCCDILKTLINDFALVFDVDKANKTFTFGKLNDIMSSNVYELKLVKNNTKSFYIDNYKQNQSIVYDNDDKNKNTGAYLVKCENQNIEEGKETDELFKIDRTIFYSSMYKSGTMRGGKYVYSNVPNLMSNDTEKKLMYTTATVSPVGGDIRYFIATCEQNADRASEYKRVFLKNTVNTTNVITKIEQPTVGASLVYSILNEIVRTPIRYEVEVEMNAKLLYNFKHFAICRVDGLVGYYYIQSINDFNPRTDNTMTLTLIKLPPVVVDVFKAIITENDIELITENDIQVITEYSKN
ncbi:MAG: hypothetical protein MJ197_08845, partial [Bacteroidales bacterium]|nr:hypothetical protein [Bacteroidales bacterium]